MPRRWRVYHPQLAPRAGDRVVLADDEAHHVARVLRLRPGDRVDVFDGRGTEWRGRRVASTADRVEVELEQALTDAVEPGLELTLFQALCRSERMAWVIQKATEVGVAAIRPLAAERADARAPDARRLERWRRITVEACKQSGRRRLPTIEPASALPAAAEGVPAWMLAPGSGESLGAALATLAPPPAAWLAVGPESGFTDGELERGRHAGWRAVGLGPRILRTETAGLVAASILLHRWSDLGG